MANNISEIIAKQQLRDMQAEKIKEKAWELLKHSNVIEETNSVDNYIEAAIIIADKFENTWRKKWVKLQEREQNREL